MSTAKPMFWEPSGRTELPLHTRANATAMMAKNLTRKEIFVKWTHKQGRVCSSSNQNRKFILHMEMTLRLRDQKKNKIGSKKKNEIKKNKSGSKKKLNQIKKK